MVQTTARQEIKWNPKSFNMQDIIDNFTNIFDDMAANSKEITVLAQRQTWTITKMFETPGKHIIMASDKHPRCKVIDAFATLGDNVDLINHSKFLGDTLQFTATENAGKDRAFRLPFATNFHFKDPVEIEQDSIRRIKYTMTFESIEERED